MNVIMFFCFSVLQLFSFFLSFWVILIQNCELSIAVILPKNLANVGEP
jgi:hypothetical protein